MGLNCLFLSFPWLLLLSSLDSLTWRHRSILKRQPWSIWSQNKSKAAIERHMRESDGEKGTYWSPVSRERVWAEQEETSFFHKPPSDPPLLCLTIASGCCCPRRYPSPRRFHAAQAPPLHSIGKTMQTFYGCFLSSRARTRGGIEVRRTSKRARTSTKRQTNGQLRR